MVVSEVGVSIAQVDLVGLEASVGVVLACHRSGNRKDGLSGGRRGWCVVGVVGVVMGVVGLAGVVRGAGSIGPAG